MMSTVSVEASGGATTIVVQPGLPKLPAARKTLLTDSLFEIVKGLNASVRSQDGRTVVDVRVEDRLPDSARLTTAAFIAAVKGVIQTLTLELPPESPTTVNLIVSLESQSNERQRTSQYLLSDDGGYSLGTTYDLRGESA